MRRFILVLKTYFWFTLPVLSRYLLHFRSLYLVLSHVLKTVLEDAWAPLLRSFFNRFYFQTSWSAQRGVAEPITKGTGRGKVKPELKEVGGGKTQGGGENSPQKETLKETVCSTVLL